MNLNRVDQRLHRNARPKLFDRNLIMIYITPSMDLSPVSVERSVPCGTPSPGLRARPSRKREGVWGPATCMNTLPLAGESDAVAAGEGFVFASRSRRTGVTLMECIFAIGVVLTGLVGLAALIPVASQNARDTMEVDRSYSESTSASAVGLVQSFRDLDTLVMYDKPVANSLGVGVVTIGGKFYGGYLPRTTPGPFPTGSLQTVEAKIDQPTPGGTPPTLGKLETPGYIHMELGSGLSSGLCIDPFGMADLALMSDARSFVQTPNGASPFRAPETTDTAFDFSRFPYFSERYRVLTPPNIAVGTAPNANVGLRTTPWPMSPRMYRVTLKSPLYDSNPFANGMFRFQLIAPVAARSIFGANSGLSSVEAADKEFPRSYSSDTSLVNNRLIDGARDAASDYTWFATLVPSFNGGDSFRQSVVVVRKRLPPTPRRVGDPVALQKANYTIDDADDNPSAERLTWVDPAQAIGFNGGSGGEITVYGSQAVSSKIDSNSWVMLSRQPHQLVAGSLSANGPAVHRWYRVISVGEVERANGFAWAGGTNDVWARRLSLAGSDWAFQDEDTSANINTTPIDDTFCTIVEGAVSVVESEVKLQ